MHILQYRINIVVIYINAQQLEDLTDGYIPSHIL